MGSTAIILVVEDNEGDQYLFREALKHVPLPVLPHFVADGVEALEFLRHEGKYAQSPVPDAVVLDFNLPMKDGKEVLADLKAVPELGRIPVLVVSTSSSPDDLEAALALGASAYHVKPATLNELVDMVKGIVEFCYRLPRFRERIASPRNS